MAPINDEENVLVDHEYSESHKYRAYYEGCSACNPSSRFHRSFVFIFMCLLAFGSYYCYDNPSALQTQIKNDLNITDATYANLYSWYSYPNVILCFFGGFLIDAVFGIRMGAIVFATFICVGQVVFAAGAYIGNFWVMVLGRFIFGLGGESLAVTQNTYAVVWFSGKELNTAFGLLMSVGRVGSMVNFNTIVYVYEQAEKFFEGHKALGATLLFASALCLLSLLCAVILALLDKRAERILNRGADAPTKTVHFSDVLYFPTNFWFLCFICVTYYVTIFPFISIGSEFLQIKYNISEMEADMYVGLPYIVSAIASPLFGMLCDFTGLNLMWTLIAAVTSCMCHLALRFVPGSIVPPYVVMGLLGLTFSLLACAFWPMVAMVIPEHQLGTAYGVMQAMQNLGLAVAIQIAGIIETRYGQHITEYFFISWVSLSILACLVLCIYDMATRGPLNPTSHPTRRSCCRAGCGDDEDEDDRIPIARA